MKWLWLTLLLTLASCTTLDRARFWESVANSLDPEGAVEASE